MTSNTIRVSVSMPTPSDSLPDVPGALDLDATVAADGFEASGEVTMVPSQDERFPGYIPYGPSPDHWVSSGLLAALDEHFRGDLPRVLAMVAAEAATACEAGGADKTEPDLDVTPEFLGFDLRAESLAVALRTDVRSVRYDQGGEPKVARGSTVELVDYLEEAGYEVAVVNGGIGDAHREDQRKPPLRLKEAPVIDLEAVKRVCLTLLDQALEALRAWPAPDAKERIARILPVLTDGLDRLARAR